MKNIYRNLSYFTLGLIIQGSILAQCGAPVLNGSAGNIFTQIRNSTNPVAADKNLNTVVFIHRNNSGTFGGNTGHLRYDVSTNAGATWTVDQGVLNPINTNLARYPNVTIYNPTLNVNPMNAHLGYMAATIDATFSAWNGVVTGVRKLDGTGNTENYNQPVISPQLIAHSVVKGAPGIFWAIDALYNGSAITGLTVYKGQWNVNDITWSNNFSVNPPFNTNYSNAVYIGDYNIAFDPTGQIGWLSFLSHVTPGPSNYAYYPVFYKTTNGGATWTGPIQVDLNQFSCITGNIGANNVATANFEHDLTVDVNGNPHLFTTICNGTNMYSVFYTMWHHMYDITMASGMWVAYDVANVNAGRGTWGTPPNAASMDMAPQVARSVDGTKLFFSWSDNSNYSLGTFNLSPNFFTRGYDVTQNKWTAIKDLSSCNGSLAGKILFPHMAPEVLEPALNTFKLASVYGEYTVPNDPLQASTFYFLDNALYTSAEFSINPPSSTITVQPNPVLLCPNSTVNISVTGSPGQVLWSTGSTLAILPVSNPTISTYSVQAQQACYVGTASVSVVNLTINVAVPPNGVCPGNTIALNVSGNALNYTWNPGFISGTTAIVVASVNPVYSVTAGGSGNCTTTQTVGITIFPLPTITITGNDTICIGSSAIKTASGAAIYSWSNGPTIPTVTLTPVVNTTYTVTGVDANSCVNTQTTSIVINPLPTLTTISSESVICVGKTVSLTASGAFTYSWTGIGGTQIVASTPSATTIYSVTGTDANLCSSSATISVLVNPLPTVTIVSSKTLHCVGEKAFSLTANGAIGYTWSVNGVTTKTILVNPTTTTSYTVTGKNAEGCISTKTLTQIVSNCSGISGTQIEKQSIIIYPNPNKGSFFIRSEEFDEFKIYNELGELVRTASPYGENNNEVEIKDLPAGIYFVISEKSGIPGQKIVVSR